MGPQFWYNHNQGLYPVLSSPGRFLFCPHDSSRYPSDTRYHKQNKKKPKKNSEKHNAIRRRHYVQGKAQGGRLYWNEGHARQRAKRGPESDKFALKGRHYTA